MPYVVPLAIAGATTLICSAIEVAVPASATFLPVGGTAFNQTAVFIILAVAYAMLHDHIVVLGTWIAERFRKR